ncbi:WD repeat-containing protein 53 [Aplysia californica]|uniref:WD repeat-containing protein 53 n=1 Tax=Aplysia californica TaxID=6500 RepID=A0ABM0JVY9_APLCA|nr:WD repeat-containing protein 53 [Aplysia californica]
MATTKLTGGHTSSVLCVGTQRQSGQIVSGAEDGDLCLWSREGQVVTKVTRPDSECTSAIFSKDNPNIVYAAFGQEVLLLDITRAQEPIFVFQSNQEEVNQLALDSKEQFLAACDDSGEIKVYGLQDRKVFKTLRHKHTNICSAVSFRPGKQWEIVSGGLDCRLVHWDFSKPKCLNQFNMQELYATPGDSPHMINPPFVHHIASSPSGSTFACALENGQLPLLNASHKNLQPKHALFAHTQGVSQVQFLNEDNIVSAGNDSCIVHWDLSKAALYQPDAVVTNGDSHGATANPEEEKNLAITELCKVRSFSHPCKVNWMALSVTEAEQKLFVADQTPDISVLTL